VLLVGVATAGDGVGEPHATRQPELANKEVNSNTRNTCSAPSSQTGTDVSYLSQPQRTGRSPASRGPLESCCSSSAGNSNMLNVSKKHGGAGSRRKHTLGQAHRRSNTELHHSACCQAACDADNRRKTHAGAGKPSSQRQLHSTSTLRQFQTILTRSGSAAPRLCTRLEKEVALAFTTRLEAVCSTAAQTETG
jgi:hypothetical protein